VQDMHAGDDRRSLGAVVGTAHRECHRGGRVQAAIALPPRDDFAAIFEPFRQERELLRGQCSTPPN
jgi:hypothetical protein